MIDAAKNIVLAALAIALGLACLDARAANPAATASEQGHFNLAGQAGLPQYLKCDAETIGDANGLSGGEIRTRDSDFFSKDFTLDVVFQWEPGVRHEAVVGIGESKHSGAAVADCIEARLRFKDRSVEVGTPRRKPQKIGTLDADSMHLLRMQKSGDTLTFSICNSFDGTFKDDGHVVVSNFKNLTPSFNRLNSSLYFGGQVIFKSVRLEVNGAAVDPGAAADKIAKEVVDSTPLFKIQQGSGVPGYVSAPNDAAIGADGIELSGAHLLQTHESDFINKDFTLDVVYTLKSDPRAMMFIGIGQANMGSGLTDESIAGQIFGQRHDGQFTLAAKNRMPTGAAKLGKDHASGPNMARLQKRGNTLMLAICADYKDKFVPDVVQILPDVKDIAAGLSDHNSSLFIGNNCTVQAMRLVVNGAVVDPGAAPSSIASSGHSSHEAASPSPAPEPIEGLFNLAGGAGLPKYLKCDADTVATQDGLIRGEVRTRDADFIDKDFTLDLVFQWKDRGNHRGILGIGDYGHQWIGARLQGIARIVEAEIPNVHQAPLIAKLDADGPQFIRMQKTGDTLTFSVCGNFNGKFVPDAATTISNLKEKAPFLTRLNSGVYFGGDVIIKSVRLQVNGVTVDPGEPDKNAKEVAGDAGFYKFHSGAGFPSFISPDTSALIGRSGVDLKGEQSLHTRIKDLIHHNFTFDIIYHFDQDTRSPMRIGLGDERQVEGQIFGPAREGNFAVAADRKQILSSNLGKDNSGGSNMVRLQKRGSALTVAVCCNYTGTFRPDVSYTLPDVTDTAPYLNDRNSSLFVSDSATIEQMRLMIDGVDADNSSTVAQASGKPPDASSPVPQSTATPSPGGTSAHASVNDSDDLLAPPAALVKLRSGRGLPSYLQAVGDALAGREGYVDGTIRTRNPIPLSQDFTVDILFKFNDNDSELRAGYGDSEHDDSWVWKALMIKVHGPGKGNHVELFHGGGGGKDMGATGKTLGPNLLRIEKKGASLTFAVCDDYKDKFDPSLVRTVPDIKNDAPFLNDHDARVFVQGDRITIMGVSVSINGKPAVDQAQAYASATPPVGGSGAGNAGGQGSGTSGVNPPPQANAEGDQPRQGVIELPDQNHKLVQGYGGTMLLLSGDQLRRLGSDGFTVRDTYKLPKTYEWIGERKDYFVAMSNEKKCLDIIDKAMHIRRSIQMDYFERHDLCLDSGRPISFVSVAKVNDEGTLHAILVVNEGTGDVHEPDDFIGTWLQVSPDGHVLYSAYKDIYKKGDRLLFNPESIDIVPVYGNIDLLIIYDISGDQPHFAAIKREVGANGAGLVLSPDGKRISYLSFTGYPNLTKDIPAWDTNDLGKRPVSYMTKEQNASCTDIAFHPYLPLAAAPSAGGAALFNRETGEADQDRLGPHVPLDGVHVTSVSFSPDGRNIILDCKDADSYFLVKAPINLHPGEAQKLKDPSKMTAPAPPPSPEKPNSPPEKAVIPAQRAMLPSGQREDPAMASLMN